MIEHGDGPHVVEHTPRQLRLFSDIGHVLEGVLVGVSSVSALRAAVADRQESDRWPVLTAAAGLVLSGGLLAVSGHHGGPARLFREDPQQRQHFVMGGLITAGAIGEVASRRTSPGPLKLLWPASVGAVGWMFLTHAQHGTGEAVVRARRAHRRLGATFVAAAGARLASLLMESRLLAFAWPSALLSAAVQLVVYREPEGAYEAGAS